MSPPVAAYAEAMLDHLSIQCADFGGERRVLRRGARAARRRRGSWTSGRSSATAATASPSFWIGPQTTGGDEPRVPHRVHGRRPGDGASVLRRGGRDRRRGAARAARLARVPPRTTTARSCAIPTATTSRPSATSRSDRAGRAQRRELRRSAARSGLPVGSIGSASTTTTRSGVLKRATPRAANQARAASRSKRRRADDERHDPFAHERVGLADDAPPGGRRDGPRARARPRRSRCSRRRG